MCRHVNLSFVQYFNGKRIISRQGPILFQATMQNIKQKVQTEGFEKPISFTITFLK